LLRIGEKYGKTSAQIALKFLIQNGIIIIPKTTHRDRMMENINLFDFTLTDDDLQEIRLPRYWQECDGMAVGCAEVRSIECE
jgi:diketogulonate reductase-like aldo/keto reductase